MNIVSAYKSDTGQLHTQNDDFVWVDDSAGVYIVADGMGGHEAGDIASKMTGDTVGTMLVEALAAAPAPPSEADVKAVVIEAIETANKAVFSAGQKAAQKRRMGTTIVAAVVQNSQTYISHAGDSRAYLARGSDLTQLTEDDSWGAQFAAAGVDTASEGGKGRFDHFLTKSVGQETDLDPSFRKVQLQPGDWLLLCSDGLWNMVDDKYILSELLKAQNDPQQAVDTLVSAANTAGGRDNISVIAIKFLP